MQAKKIERREEAARDRRAEKSLGKRLPLVLAYRTGWDGVSRRRRVEPERPGLYVPTKNQEAKMEIRDILF